MAIPEHITATTPNIPGAGATALTCTDGFLGTRSVVVAQREVSKGNQRDLPDAGPARSGDLDGVVVTGDAAHTQTSTARYIAGKRDADYFLTVKGNQPGLQAPIFDKIQAGCGPAVDHVAVQEGHGRVVKRSLWVTAANGIDFPHATQIVRIRRDVYDQRVSKEIVHAVTSLHSDHAGPALLASLAQGQWGIELIHWLRDAVYRDNRAYTVQGSQVMATFRNLAISLLHLGGITKIKAALQQIGRDRDRVLAVLPYEANDTSIGSRLSWLVWCRPCASTAQSTCIRGFCSARSLSPDSQVALSSTTRLPMMLFPTSGEGP